MVSGSWLSQMGHQNQVSGKTMSSLTRILIKENMGVLWKTKIKLGEVYWGDTLKVKSEKLISGVVSARFHNLYTLLSTFV